ncbi:MAG: translation elongation factor 4, partial [Oscillospiraceae bacterium]|nr:translation elongation factor 4 [Oscillospiraceae bacterium]
MSYTDLSRVRNFCIIAHIDHGKSTLADRLLEMTGAVALRDMQEQYLDSMELERERGITIKSKPVRLEYKAQDGQNYILNLIDTPGHVDFTYEVSRALAACEGALLVVDATQGVEAQTLANAYLALDHNLEIIPVINKIDLASAMPDEAKQQIEEIIGIDAEDAPLISAKNGIGIDAVLEAVVKRVPPPSHQKIEQSRALIFDSYYDNYRGAICTVRVMDGEFRAGQKIRMMAGQVEFDVTEVGAFRPIYHPMESLQPGEVGYIAASIKDIRDTKVGDTITDANNPAAEALPGYRPALSMVFCGIYPADGARYGDLREALEKLRLNDAALLFEPETSAALGAGFRCGFLGLLHMEVIQERLEREFDLDLVTTAPSVIYEIVKTNDTIVYVDNPTNLPPIPEILELREPIVNATIYTPKDYVGSIMELCQNKRGVYKEIRYEGGRALLVYDLPLNEILFDFFEAIKSRSRGYASFDYEFVGYVKSDLVKLDLLLNGDICDALSLIVHREKAYGRGRSIAEKLRDAIPRQQFEIPVQAAIGGKVIARETVKAVRKDVLAKCYGGDITRKKKLLEKQKEGKKRMRQFGTVSIPSEA